MKTIQRALRLRARIGAAFACCAAVLLALRLGAANDAFGQIPNIPGIPNPPSAYQAPTSPSRPFTPIERDFVRRMEELQRQAAEEAKKEEKVDTPEETLEKLLEEFGPTARYGYTRYFLYIYDTSDAYAYWCANLVENAAKAYVAFAKKLKLPIADIAEPMVVVIFKRKEDYEAYLKKVVGTEFDNAKNKPVGCYFPHLNRSIFYDMTGLEATAVNDDASRKKTFEDVAKEILARPNAEEDLSVVVHEATHQVSYNLGLFSRLGDNPAWTVEGLAMLFEPPCGDPKFGGWKPEKDLPINKRRIQEFLAYVQENPDPLPVRKCALLDQIRGDEPGAYPVSWAIFSYLYKKNPKLLAYYLYYYQIKNASPTFSNGTQIQEFERFFGTDWDGMYLQLKVFADAQLLQANGVDEAEAEKQARKKHGLPEEPEPPQKTKKPKPEKTPKSVGDANAKPDAEKEKKQGAAKPSESPDSKPNPEAKKKPEKKADEPKNAETQEDDWLDAWTEEPETKA